MAGTYPKLMWSAADEEVTVHNEVEEADRVAEGYRLVREPQERVLQNESTVDDHKKKAKK